MIVIYNNSYGHFSNSLFMFVSYLSNVMIYLLLCRITVLILFPLVYVEPKEIPSRLETLQRSGVRETGVSRHHGGQLGAHQTPPETCPPLGQPA